MRGEQGKAGKRKLDFMEHPHPSHVKPKEKEILQKCIKLKNTLKQEANYYSTKDKFVFPLEMKWWDERSLLSVKLEKESRKKQHPAVNFYWDIILKIWLDIFFVPKQIVDLRNYLVKLSTSLQSYVRYTYFQDTYVV